MRPGSTTKCCARSGSTTRRGPISRAGTRSWTASTITTARSRSASSANMSAFPTPTRACARRWSTAASPTAPRSTSSGSTPSCSSIPTPNVAAELEPLHGILVPGGFGERGSEGKIASVKFAREREIPFFGICLGMQMACIEAARNLAGIERSLDHRVRRDARAGRRPDHRMDERGRAAAARRRRRPRRHDAARRLSGEARRQQRRPLDLRQRRDQRAAPPPLRGQHPLSSDALEKGGPALLRHVARRPAARDRRAARPSVVHRRPVPPRAEEPPVRAASLVRRLHRGGASSSRGWSNQPAEQPARFVRYGARIRNGRNSPCF